MPLNKLRQLSDQIVKETDPIELARLIAELTEHLKHRQAALDEQIERIKRLSNLKNYASFFCPRFHRAPAHSAL